MNKNNIKLKTIYIPFTIQIVYNKRKIKRRIFNKKINYIYKKIKIVLIQFNYYLQWTVLLKSGLKD